MPMHFPEAEEAAQRARIEALKRRAEELAGGQMLTDGSEDLPLNLREQFWRNVVESEQSCSFKLRHLLAQDGVRPPPADALSDEELLKELNGLIEALAVRNTYLEFTDHLSDRELYRLLVERVLDDEAEDLPAGSGWNSHVDMSVCGEDQDGMENYLRYYAMEADREQWARDYPEDTIPPHVDPPYDRDHGLPRPG